MPETRSAQGALPLRSAYPARDLTHSTGRRAISPDKTTGIPGKRLWPSFLFVQCRTQSALDIFHSPYTLRSKDEERPDINLLSWIAVLRSIGCGPFFHGAGERRAFGGGFLVPGPADRTFPVPERRRLRNQQGSHAGPCGESLPLGPPHAPSRFFFSVTPRPPSVPPPATCSF